MYKLFYLNKDYSFDNKGNLRIKGKDIVWDKDKIDVEIQGNFYSFDLKWFWLITHYEVFLPIEDLLKINFIRNESRVIKLKCGFMMIIETPIYPINHFRIIPGFPNFAINVAGEVKSFRGKRCHTLKEGIGPYGYPYVNIYDPDKNMWRSVSVHILLAKAFIKNTNPYEKFYINHIDGNKLNYKLNNLEWCSSRENINHAFAAGLRNDNLECKMRDIKTGNITQHQSITAALLVAGISGFKSIKKTVNGITIPRLFNRRYEIKLIEENDDWFYNENNCFEKFYNKGPFQALRLTDNLIYEEQTISQLAAKINIDRTRIENEIKSTTPHNVGGYLFRIKSDSTWPDEYGEIAYIPPRSFEINNRLTNEIKRFNSSRKLRKFLGLDKKTLKNRLINNKPYNDWFIKEI